MENGTETGNIPSSNQVIIWKDEYLTGVPEVDFQHQYFVSLINRISNELSTNEDREQQVQLLWELVKYAELHFLTEENILRKGAFEGRERHHELHEAIAADLAKKVQLAMSNVITPAEIIDFLVEWFTDHSASEDKVIFAQRNTNP